MSLLHCSCIALLDLGRWKSLGAGRARFTLSVFDLIDLLDLCCCVPGIPKQCRGSKRAVTVVHFIADPGIRTKNAQRA